MSIKIFAKKSARMFFIGAIILSAMSLSVCNRSSNEQTESAQAQTQAQTPIDTAAINRHRHIARTVERIDTAADAFALLSASHFVGFEYDCSHHAALDSICAGYGRDRVAPIRGIVYNTIISEDSVAVRDAPSYESTVLFHLNKFSRIQILGVSRESSLIDNEHWVKVRIKTPDGWLDDEYWIFARNIAYRGGEKINPATFHTFFENDSLIGRYAIDGDSGTIAINAVAPAGDEHPNAHYFYYCMHRAGAHYRLIPGLYLRDNETGAQTHVSYKTHIRFY